MCKKFLCAIALALVWAGSAFGQGIIIPRDCRRCPEPPIDRPHPLPRVLKVKSVQLTTRIDSQVATTKVEQVFENDTPYRLEGSYFFPIPESATISDFAIYDGDRRMAAEVMERNKARQIYNEIVRKMIDPGLLEYASKDLFQANVFPIEPRSTRKIELSYTQVLKAEGGTVSYRYELGAGRRMLAQPVHQIAASVDINSPIALKNLFSPSHNISIKRDGEKRARLSFEGSGQDAQKDFQLYYSLSEKDFGLSLLTHREPGKDGYFLMLISPKVEMSERERISKDVIFVFDTSGSMSGEKITKAKAALRFGVESLAAGDRFNIVSFSGEEHLMKGGLVAATEEAKATGRRFIENIRAEGGTNINDALLAALKQFEPSDRARMVVFLTDGLPTVGTTNIEQIIKNTKDANRANVRLFSFGVGYDVNTTLLDRLSANNGGSSDYIEPNEDLEIKVSNFFAKVNYPVLSDLKLDLGGIEADLIYPRSLPDLFKGSQITVAGRYKKSLKDATIRLTGNVSGQPQVFTFANHQFASESTTNGFLPRLWATRRTGYLLEQIRLNGENRELVDEIVGLGTRFGIVTPYTSFLVTDDVKDASLNRVPFFDRTQSQSIRGSGGGNPPAGAPTGREAVARSRAENEMKQSASNSTLDQYVESLRTVGNKTFLLKDGVWVDTEFKPDSALQVVKLKFGSDEFFSLILAEPQLSEFFALGQKIVLVYKGKVYQVE